MNLPTAKEIEQLHHKYAQTDEVFTQVYGHCQIVWRIAEQLIEKKNLDVDKSLVQVGCLLHDIGVYDYFDKSGQYNFGKEYIAHGLLGKELLEREGFSETIQRFASHHTGLGLTRDEIIKEDLPLPHQDFIPDTPEERLLMYADKFHHKVPPFYFNTFDWYENFCRKFGDDEPQKFASLRDEFGEPELEELAQEYGQELKY